MNFTVELNDEAEDDLADAWLTAPDRPAVTRASAATEQVLAANPTQGLYLSEGLWRFVAAPLAVHYSIDTIRRHVLITHVGRTA